MAERRRLVGVVTSNKMTKTVVVEVTHDFIAGDRHVMNAALIDLREQLAERNVPDRRSLARLLEQHHQRHNQQADDGPQGEVPEVCVHCLIHERALRAERFPRDGSKLELI